MAKTPEDNRYATSHEYIHLEGDVGTIGITDYAQKELGDVVFVELPQVGLRRRQTEHEREQCQHGGDYKLSLVMAR